MRQKGSGVHVPSCPIMHAFTRSPANKQAALENNTAYTLSLPMHIFAKHSRIQAPPLGKKKREKKKKKQREKKTPYVYVLESTCMFPPPVPFLSMVNSKALLVS